MDTQNQDYGEYVKLMYNRGFYIEKYAINLMSYEVGCIDNKIFIVPVSPINSNGEDIIYVFTGRSQKARILSEPTEYRLYLEDEKGDEFKDSDNLLLSVVHIDKKSERIDEKIDDLYTRNYATWKFGIRFDKGILLHENKYLMIQTQKIIGKFDIDITNIDLFRYKNKIERKDERMSWLD